MIKLRQQDVNNNTSKDDNPFWSSVKNLYPTETESLNTMIEELNKSTNKNQTHISKGMSINGDVELKNSMKHAGAIYGNVDSSEDIELVEDAKIEGDVKAKNLCITFGAVTGNITCQEDITTEGPSLISGNLKAVNIQLAGQVEGKIEATNKLKLCKTAVIHGDIVASLIEVEEGALIYGNVVIQEDKNKAYSFIDQSSFA
jgi:cytoskeletal protein CcmA (bactofilin family)